MQMQTLSARIPTEDMEWLTGLQVSGAVSPSDKLRALIAQMRRQHEGTVDYERSLVWLRDLAAPFVTSIKAAEHRERIHSELVSLAAEWVPQIMATMLSERGGGKDAQKHLLDLEALLAQRCFQFLTSLLRLAVTPGGGCYNPAVIDKYTSGVLEIAEIVMHLRKMREQKDG